MTDQVITFQEALAKQKELDAECTGCGRSFPLSKTQQIVARAIVQGTDNNGVVAFLRVGSAHGDLFLGVHGINGRDGPDPGGMPAGCISPSGLRRLADLREAADRWRDGAPLEMWEPPA